MYAGLSFTPSLRGIRTGLSFTPSLRGIRAGLSFTPSLRGIRAGFTCTHECEMLDELESPQRVEVLDEERPVH